MAAAVDSAHHRLFVGCRMYATQPDWWLPGRMIVMNTDTGKMIAQFPAVGGSDEMFFDAASQRIYLQGYEGIADVWREADPDHYESIGRIQGGIHGKTSMLVPELKRYYVAVSEHRDVVEGVQGGLDHLGVDVPGKRLFIAALGDKQNTVEVVDLKSNQRISSIPGQSKPQGIFYSSDFNKLFVANGGDGTCKIFVGDTFKLINSFPVGDDADHVGYDPATHYLYIGTGDAKSGALAVIDTRTGTHVGGIKTDARPGGIKFDKSNSQIYVTLAGSSKLGVVDRKKREQVTTWAVAGVPGNVALALDEKHHR